MLRSSGQSALLEEAKRSVRECGFRMEQQIESNDVAAAVDDAVHLLKELRTSQLSPTNYYELYMLAVNELRKLEVYFEKLQKSGTSIQSLYDRVESSSSVLPRLYLLFTVGSVDLKSNNDNALAILTDLADMAKGVQHPLRGLFLREYFSNCVNDDLFTSNDLLHLLLQNFREMNRLWIRIKHQKLSSETQTEALVREQERYDLRVLVGTSLNRLSQSDQTSLDLYTSQILPQVLEILVTCKDAVAQEYILDCIIQAFPVNFHLPTLDRLLMCMKELKPEMNWPSVLQSLLQRLTLYMSALEEAAREDVMMSTSGDGQGKDLFAKLLSGTKKLQKKHPKECADENLLGLFHTLVNFVLEAGNQSMSRLNAVSSFVLPLLQEGYTDEDASDDGRKAIRKVIDSIATSLLRSLHLSELMQLEYFPPMLQLLPYKTSRRKIALTTIDCLFDRKEHVDSVPQVSFLLQTLLAPLVYDDRNSSPTSPEVFGYEAFDKEQQKVSKVISLLQTDDLDTLFLMFSTARKCFGQGGVHRIKHTLTPLVYRSLPLARQLHAQEEEKYTVSSRQVLQFVHEMVTALASKLEMMSLGCISLFTHSALAADACEDHENIAYEFMTQAFIVYEDQVTASRDQWRALELVTGALRSIQNLSRENYEVLATKATQYGAKLLRKNEQGAMILRCAHLFWHPKYQDGKSVLECLQRSLRIADACSDSSSSVQVVLFLECLEAYVYFYAQKTPEVTANYVNGLLALVNEHLENMEPGQAREEGEDRYYAIVHYLKTKGLMSGGVLVTATAEQVSFPF